MCLAEFAKRSFFWKRLVLLKIKLESDPDPSFHFDAHLDPTFDFESDPDPNQDPVPRHSDAKLRLLVYRPSTALFLASKPPY